MLIINQCFLVFHFPGDSQAMHFFIAVVLLITKNYKHGGIKLQYLNDQNITTKCHNEYLLFRRECRHYIISSTDQLKSICGRRREPFEIEFLADYQSFLTGIVSEKLKKLYHLEDTYVILSSASHFNSDFNSFLNYYLKPVAHERKKSNSYWPKLLIETMPAVYSPTATKKRDEFNQVIRRYARSNDIHVFENFQLTSNLESFNGRTFGLNYNTLKVRLLLNYFHDISKCKEI